MQEREEEHFVGVVVQKALIEQDGKVLLIKNNGDTIWDFPGGRLNVGELPAEGLAREVKEEIGCECTVGDVLYTNQYVHASVNKPMMLLIYRVSISSDVTIANDELSEWAWIDPNKVKEEETYTDYVDILKLA